MDIHRNARLPLRSREALVQRAARVMALKAATVGSPAMLMLVPKPKIKERVGLAFLRNRVILRPLDTPVDIGVLAEKEVIQ